MSFYYTCECGFVLPIAAASAGTVVPCRCGRQVKIPKLSELKRLSGHREPPPPVNIADELRLMYLDKELPTDTHCMYCQVHTTTTLECWVECERARHPGGSTGSLLFKALLFGLLGFLYIPNIREGEAVGTDLVVRTPLPICENCLHTTSRSESNIRQLLMEVGLYRQLLETYPGARVGAG